MVRARRLVVVIAIAAAILLTASAYAEEAPEPQDPQVIGTITTVTPLPAKGACRLRLSPKEGEPSDVERQAGNPVCLHAVKDQSYELDKKLVLWVRYSAKAKVDTVDADQRRPTCTVKFVPIGSEGAIVITRKLQRDECDDYYVGQEVNVDLWAKDSGN